ncbi:hypothetical protein D3C81_1769550 [compost metagenome]
MTLIIQKLVRQPLFVLLLQAIAILRKTLTEVIRLDGSTLDQRNYRRSKRHEQLRLGVAVCLQRLTEKLIIRQAKTNVIDPVTFNGVAYGFVSHLESLNVLRLNNTGRKGVIIF